LPYSIASVKFGDSNPENWRVGSVIRKKLVRYHKTASAKVTGNLFLGKKQVGLNIARLIVEFGEK
jgi:hypothetical protein